eukprot:139957-Amphidinium_carterae.2
MDPGVQERVDAIECNLTSSEKAETAVPAKEKRSRTRPRTEESVGVQPTTQVSEAPVAPEGFVQRKTDEVKSRALAKHEEAGFRAAMRVEAPAMLKDRHGMTPLTWDETQQVRREKGDRIIPMYYTTQVALAMKTKGDRTWHGVCSEGSMDTFKHPDLDVLMADSYSPTPCMFAISIGLCALASLKYEVYVADLAQVFLQSEDISREIYVEQPEEGRRCGPTCATSFEQGGVRHGVGSLCMASNLVERTIQMSLSEQLAVELQEEALTGKEDDQKKRVVEDSSNLPEMLLRFQHIHEKLSESDLNLAAELKTLREDVVHVHDTIETVKNAAVDRMAAVETKQDQMTAQINNLRSTTRQLQEIIQLMYDDEDEKKKPAASSAQDEQK